MSNVTQIIRQIEAGDSTAAERLLPLVYDELKRLAAAKLVNERADHTLQATALVHEAYVRLVDREQAPSWESKSHFFAAAAEAMRRILVESARRKGRLKRGGQHRRVDWTEQMAAMTERDSQLLALDEALTKFAELEPEKAKLVVLRHFAGLTLEQAAKTLGVSRATASRHWSYARAWLYHEICEKE